MVRRLFILCLLLLVSVPVYADIIPDTREVDWAGAGVDDDGERPSWADTAAVSTLSCPTDGSDATTCIQAGINALTANTKVAYLPTGTYTLSSGGISISTSNRILRGAGAAATILKITAAVTTPVVGGNAVTDLKWENEQDCLNDLAVGDSTLDVADPTGFVADDWIIISEINDPKYVETENGSVWGGYATSTIQDGGRYVSEINQISSVSNSTITLAKKVHWAYLTSNTCSIMEVGPFDEYIGIEDLTVYENDATGGNAGANIELERCSNCWVYRVWSRNVNGKGIRLRQAIDSTVSSSYISSCINGYGSGGTCYGISIDYVGTDNLVFNNISRYMNGMYIAENTGGGNVWAYNWGDSAVQDGDLTYAIGNFATHLYHNNMDLYEGNWVDMTYLDTFWGSSSHLTYFRNYSDMSWDEYSPSQNRRAYYVEGWHRYENVVGNVFGQSSFAGTYEHYNVADCENEGPNGDAIYQLFYQASNCTNANADTTSYNTLIRHGNFDYYSDTVKWDGGIADHNIPDSYYLSSAPSVFSDNGYTWPWVTPDEGTKIHKQPAEERWQVYSVSDDIADLFIEVDQGGGATTTDIGTFSGTASGQ